MFAPGETDTRHMCVRLSQVPEENRQELGEQKKRCTLFKIRGPGKSPGGMTWRLRGGYPDEERGEPEAQGKVQGGKSLEAVNKEENGTKDKESDHTRSSITKVLRNWQVVF